MGFTILRDRDEGSFSTRLRINPYAVRLVEGTHRIREFNVIELDFVAPEDVVHRRCFFSIDHGYAPVRYEWIDANDGSVTAEVDVLALKEVSAGLWFPVKGIMVHMDDETASTYEAKDVKLNQRLTREYFDLNFPSGTVIIDETGFTQNTNWKGSFFRFAILAIVPILAIVGLLLIVGS